MIALAVTQSVRRISVNQAAMKEVKKMSMTRARTYSTVDFL